MIKIALTGNIASGKSTVENIIKELGYPVFDLDIISHNLLENECRNKILKEFETTNRKKIADVVFSDKNKLNKLESIIYPELEKFIKKTFEKNKNQKAVFISGALIVDKGFGRLFDKIIFIDTDYNLRLERLIKRNNYSPEEAKKRIEAQNDSAKAQADYIIKNNQDEKTLKQEVLNTIEKII